MKIIRTLIKYTERAGGDAYLEGYQNSRQNVKNNVLTVDGEASKNGYQKPLLQRGFLINPHILTSRLEARDDGEGLTPGEKKGGLGYEAD